MDVRVGDILLMKKKHPCGGEIMIPRAKAERHIKKITHPEEQ